MELSKNEIYFLGWVSKFVREEDELGRVSALIDAQQSSGLVA